MIPTLSDGKVEIYPLDRFNWEEVSELSVKIEQQDFLPNNVFSIAQSRFESGSELFGIRYKGKPAGMILCLLQAGGMLWISRIMVDGELQGEGIGKRALRLLLKYQHRRPGVKEIRTSVSESNLMALGFFARRGFRPLGAAIGGEVVLKWQGN